MKHVCRMLFVSLVFFAVAVFSGCTPMQRGIAGNAFYSTGTANLYVDVRELAPVGGGRFWGNVVSHAAVNPYVSADFAVFGNAGDAPRSLVGRHAHVMITSLSDASWRWQMESWPSPFTLLYQKGRTAAKFWTIQMMPVPAAGDWFSGAWQADGREVPRFWLAKRWSATPYEDTRIVAEYREPAPACMQEALLPLEQIIQGEQVSPPQSSDLRRLCPKEIDDFSARADGVFTFKTMPQTIGAAFERQMPRPAGKPNFKALAGEAEFVDRGGSDFGDTP